MKRLMLLRHAEAAPTAAGQKDIDRVLTARGIEDCVRIGRYLAEKRWTPDLALCSTARRVRQTWEFVSAELIADISSDYAEALYLATPTQLLAAVATAPTASDTIILINHNPAIGQIAQSLAARTPDGLSHRLGVEFPTAALAVFDIDTTDWSALATAPIEIAAFAQPAEL